MIHYFSEDVRFEGPYGFTDPFRYSPHPLVTKAAEETIDGISSSPELSRSFEDGKMLGVLICMDPVGHIGYLKAFSGNAGGHSTLEGFVPPIYDLTDPDGYFKKEESRISALTVKIAEFTSSEQMQIARKNLDECKMQAEEALKTMKAKMLKSKLDRASIRMSTSDNGILSGLILQSQFEKAELRRCKASWAEKQARLEAEYDKLESRLEVLKKRRSEMSDDLQNWIFRQYIVHNSLGEEADVADIFAGHGMVPPGGTGECAAPKMLEYAFRHGLRPIAMGEFWYGKSPDTAVRTQGRFYPSCTSKCGPLLKFMLKGTVIAQDTLQSDTEPDILFEDDAIIVVEKPSGMPSVPGLNGRKSLQESLTERIYTRNEGSERSTGIHAVHRLDMDTSGLMVFAKTCEAAVELRKQFESHTVKKTYMARLSACHRNKKLTEGSKGTINLPLAADHDERPRQKVDMVQGKPAVTEFKVTAYNEDGTTDVVFHPITGRTHQLRVHSAHTSGLGAPIIGDLLYGGDTYPRLCLHALSINFRHPISGKTVQFSGKKFLYV